MVTSLATVCLLLVWALPAAVRGLDLRFASGRGVAAIPFELDDNHIYLSLSVNGSRPLSFMVDTGASQTLINLKTAQSLNLPVQLAGKVENGIGTDPPDVYLVTDNVIFKLRGVEFSNQKLVAVSLEYTQACINQAAAGAGVKRGPRIFDGILGKDFFDRFVVAIDYNARQIDLFEPESYTYTGKGKSVPLEVDSQYIFITGLVKATGHPFAAARLVVDTGAGTALSLTREFTGLHKLQPPVEKLTEATECGISGSTNERNLVGTVEFLKLGDFNVKKPTTVFYQKTASRRFDGLLGGGALRHFKVIFDYSRSRMILEPSDRHSSERGNSR